MDLDQSYKPKDSYPSITITNKFDRRTSDYKLLNYVKWHNIIKTIIKEYTMSGVHAIINLLVNDDHGILSFKVRKAHVPSPLSLHA